jgi:hypothetical protein
MMNNKVFLFAVLLNACASPMHQRAFEEIQIGDPSFKVTEAFGTPDQFGESQRIPGAQAWYYKKKGTLCSFTIQDDKVAYRACDASNYASGGKQVLRAFAAGMQGAGEGLQRKRSINCTTSGNITNCAE